jgi:uncharacterized protein YdbL (DUF1318 family)
MSRIVTAVLLAPIALVLAAPAQERERPQQPQQPQTRPAPDPRAELRERMKQRYPVLQKLRDAGKVGETFAGLAGVVAAASAQDKADAADPRSPTVAQVVEDENQDRRALFALIAREERLGAAEVGKQNGIRNLDKGGPEHWFQLEDGRWVQKKAIKAVKK